MFTSVKEKMYALLVNWQIQIQKKTEFSDLDRSSLPILISVYGDIDDSVESFLQIGQQLQIQGYPVSFIGNNTAHAPIQEYSFLHFSIEECNEGNVPLICKYVEKIQEIIRQRKPALLITTANRPASISAKLEGIDLLEIDSSMNWPGYPYPSV